MLNKTHELLVVSVVQHLTVTAQDPQYSTMLKRGHKHRELLQTLIQEAAVILLQAVHDNSDSTANSAAELPAAWAPITNDMRTVAWILVADGTRVQPSQLCFSIQTRRCLLYPEPLWMSAALRTLPRAKAWLVEQLNAKEQLSH